MSSSNSASLCPTNVTDPIEASGIIPVSLADVAGILPIALTIPDFEGQAILRIFANSTQSEIGCYSASVTNGNTMAHPDAIAPVLGIFTVVAFIASLVTAIYGDHIPTIRTHYAHSLSIWVVFAVFHHVFFTGALSMNWPSVLPAFWSNFAWSAGMIYSASMQARISKFVGNTGNTGVVGAASTGSSSDTTGGGYRISQIYKRAAEGLLGPVSLHHREPESLASLSKSMPLIKRSNLQNATTGFYWYGDPVANGLPLPGNFSGFAGTLSAENIPAANAFMTALLWFLIVLLVVTASLIAFKWLLEGLGKTKLVSNDRFMFFRRHWLRYTAMAVLRGMFIAFFTFTFLALFQFVYKGSAGVIAIASIVFLIFFFGLLGIAAYACFYRMKAGRDAATPDRVHLERTKALGFLPWLKVLHTSNDPNRSDIHDDDDFNRQYGWLSARFRRSRWWFFAFWLSYEFIRACFYGGAAGQPLTQVFGLLVVEFLALITIAIMRPFEGARLNAIMVYFLGFSKVVTLGLSVAFDARFNLPRITTTIIGVVIIVIHGFLVIALMILIVLGAISSYMSLTRNREHFSPESWAGQRTKYFAHIRQAALDRPAASVTEVTEEPKPPYFNVASIRRIPKIEDEDGEGPDEAEPFSSRNSIAGAPYNATARHSRAASIRSNTSLPYGARPHRTSWSNNDFGVWQETGPRDAANPLAQMCSDVSLRDRYQVPPRSRAASRGTAVPLDVRKLRNSEKGKEKEVGSRSSVVSDPVVERPTEEASGMHAR